MTRKQIEESINWLIRTVTKIAKKLNVRIDQTVDETAVKIDQAVDGVYDSLPVSVIGEMIDEEVALCEKELGLDTE